MSRREHNIQSLLPSGYRQLEYIESTGTQWIDTGYIIQSNIVRFKGRMISTITSAEQDFVGRTFAPDGDGGIILGTYSSSNFFVYSRPRSETNDGNILVQNINYSDFEFDATYNYNIRTKTLVLNGSTYAHTMNFQPSSMYKSLLIFKAYGNANTYITKGKLCYLQIYDNGNLVRDFYPALRTADNKPGLYDLVNNQFYTNAGTGEFQSA